MKDVPVSMTDLQGQEHVWACKDGVSVQLKDEFTGIVPLRINHADVTVVTGDLGGGQQIQVLGRSSISKPVIGSS